MSEKKQEVLEESGEDNLFDTLKEFNERGSSDEAQATQPETQESSNEVESVENW